MIKTQIIIGVALLSAAPLCAEFIAIDSLHPGQHRYASLNVSEKIAHIKKKHGVIRHKGACIPAYHNNTSVLPENGPLPVVRSPFGYVLVDRHHDVLASIALGATAVPIQTIADLSAVPIDQFWRTAEEQGLVYPYRIGGHYEKPPHNFTQLRNDLNYYFANVTVRTCLDQRTENKNTRGALYPLWVKVGADMPFVEFKIADTLYQHGFTYNLTEKASPSESEVERARTILNAHPIAGLRLIRSRKHYTEIPLICALTFPQKTL